MAAPKLGEEKLLPRKPDKRVARIEWLRKLHTDECLTVDEIARLFAVSTVSVRRALARFGIERPSTCCEAGCYLSIHKVKHATNGSEYGRRCRLHQIVFRMMVNQRYNDKHLGKDDEAWLRRLRQLLARARRLNREVLQSLKPASAPATTSPAACPR